MPEHWERSRSWAMHLSFNVSVSSAGLAVALVTREWWKLEFVQEFGPSHFSLSLSLLFWWGTPLLFLWANHSLDISHSLSLSLSPSFTLSFCLSLTVSAVLLHTGFRSPVQSSRQRYETNWLPSSHAVSFLLIIHLLQRLIQECNVV